MARIEIYAKDWCPYCSAAKALLRARGLSFVHHNVTSDTTLEVEMQKRSGRTSVPQIFIDDEHIGGFDDLAALDARGAIEALSVAA